MLMEVELHSAVARMHGAVATLVFIAVNLDDLVEAVAHRLGSVMSHLVDLHLGLASLDGGGQGLDPIGAPDFEVDRRAVLGMARALPADKAASRPGLSSTTFEIRTPDDAGTPKCSLSSGVSSLNCTPRKPFGPPKDMAPWSPTCTHFMSSP